MNSRRLISPSQAGEWIVAGQTSGLEVVKTALRNVRFGSKGDMRLRSSDVRFSPKSRHRLSAL